MSRAKLIISQMILYISPNPRLIRIVSSLRVNREERDDQNWSRHQKIGTRLFEILSVTEVGLETLDKRAFMIGIEFPTENKV